MFFLRLTNGCWRPGLHALSMELKFNGGLNIFIFPDCRNKIKFKTKGGESTNVEKPVCAIKQDYRFATDVTEIAEHIPEADALLLQRPFSEAILAIGYFLRSGNTFWNGIFKNP